MKLQKTIKAIIRYGEQSGYVVECLEIPVVTQAATLPFDLTTFKYVQISQAAEIPNKIKNEIIAILRDAGAPL